VKNVKKTEITEVIDPELKQMNDEMTEAFGIMMKAIEEVIDVFMILARQKSIRTRTNSIMNIK